jgi:tubulin polyglutamylase TTLL6/13
MNKRFPNEYNFFPKTWVLPAEAGDFKAQFPLEKNKKTSKIFILKPDAA